MKNTMNNKKNVANTTTVDYKKEIKDLIEKIDDEKKLDAIYRYIKIVYLNNR